MNVVSRPGGATDERKGHIPDVLACSDGVALAVTPYSLRHRTTGNLVSKATSRMFVDERTTMRCVR